MSDKVFLLFRLTVVSKHPQINDTMREVEEKVKLSFPDMPNVKIVKQEILNLHQKDNNTSS